MLEDEIQQIKRGNEAIEKMMKFRNSAEKTYGATGGESASILALSRISLPLGASSGEKLSMSNETDSSSPIQFAGRKK